MGIRPAQAREMPTFGDLLNALRFALVYVPRSFWRAIVQPVLTVLTLLIFGFVILSYRMGGPATAWNEVFFEKHTPDQMQAELRRVTRRDALINAIMDRTLSQAPTAARARLGIIHNGAYGLTGTSILRYDITHARAKEGYTPGPLNVNSPLSNWSAYVDDLIADKCISNGPEKWSAQEHAVLAELGADFRIICPILVPPEKRLLGAFYLTWSGGQRPSAQEIEALSAVMRENGRQIAIAWEAGAQP